MPDSSFSLQGPDLEFNPELNTKSVSTSSTCSSSNSSDIKNGNGERPSFNGHAIQQTTDSERNRLIQDYLEAKVNFEKALAKYEHAKGLNWFARQFWNVMPIGKSRSVNHCEGKLEQALNDYDTAGIALTNLISNPGSLHNDKEVAEEKRNAFDHRPLNNQTNNSKERLQIGLNKLPMNSSFKAGAVLLHEIDRYNDNQYKKHTEINRYNPWQDLKTDTKNGTWKIERDDKQITSISYDDTPPSKTKSSATIEEVIAAIKEFVGPNKEAQEKAAYALHPNSFSTIALIKTQIPSDPDRPIKNAQELRSLRQLDGAGSIRPLEEKKNFKTALTKNSRSELTIKATQTTKCNCLITCNQDGESLNEYAPTKSFNHQEEDSFTRIIKQNSNASASIQTENLLLKHELSNIENTTFII